MPNMVRRSIFVLHFQFPLHWGSVPTILKGWFDRILLCEFAFILPDCRYEKGLLKVRSTFNRVN